MRFSAAALEDIASLRRYYRDKERPEALRNLAAAIRLASRKISAGDGVAAPMAYREVARPGRAWVHAGRYWFQFTTGAEPVVLAVFYDAADIPGRL